MKFGSLSGREWALRLQTIVAQFADPEYQGRVWIEGRGPETSSYEEAVNGLQDYGFEDFISQLEHAALGSERDATTLRSFQDILNQFDRDVVDGPFANPTHFSDERWQRVIAAAHLAFAALGTVAVRLKSRSE